MSIDCPTCGSEMLRDGQYSWQFLGFLGFGLSSRCLSFEDGKGETRLLESGATRAFKCHVCGTSVLQDDQKLLDDAFAAEQRGEIEHAIKLYETAVHAGFLNGESHRGCPSLGSVRLGLKHRNAKVVEAAERINEAYSGALAMVRPRVEAYLDEQIARLESTDADERCQASEALGWLRQLSAPAVDRLVRLIKNERYSNVRGQASQTLGLIGDQAIPALLSLAKSKDRSVKADALFGLDIAGDAANRPDVIAFLRLEVGRNEASNIERIERMLQSFETQTGK